MTPRGAARVVEWWPGSLDRWLIAAWLACVTLLAWWAWPYAAMLLR